MAGPFKIVFAFELAQETSYSCLLKVQKFPLEQPLQTWK